MPEWVLDMRMIRLLSRSKHHDGESPLVDQLGGDAPPERQTKAVAPLSSDGDERLGEAVCVVDERGRDDGRVEQLPVDAVLLLAEPGGHAGQLLPLVVVARWHFPCNR